MNIKFLTASAVVLSLAMTVGLMGCAKKDETAAPAADATMEEPAATDAAQEAAGAAQDAANAATDAAQDAGAAAVDAAHEAGAAAEHAAGEAADHAAEPAAAPAASH